MHGHFNRFFATVTCGLETVLLDEIKELGTEVRELQVERGKVMFQAFQEVDQLKRLRCANNLYGIISEWTVGAQKSGLAQIESQMRKIHWRRIAADFGQSSPVISVSASRRGKHAYSRFDVMKAMLDALEKDGFTIARQHTDAFYIRADVDESLCRISVKLTDEQFRFRGNTRVFTKGCISPTIAAALVRINKPGHNDVFYDPFCGSGTIPNERAYFSARRILASDINEEAVLAAQTNCKGRATVFRCDARNTPSRTESIDQIVTNPPWNKQIPVGDLRELYKAFLVEANRILKPNGRMLLLTDCHEELFYATEANRLYSRVLQDLSVHGLHPRIYEIRKAVP